MTLEKATSGGESFHTILITHGILKGGPPNGDPLSDENERPSHG